MNAPTSSLTPAEQSVLANVETEIGRLAEQAVSRAPTQIETDADRIKVLSRALDFEFNRRA